MSKTKKKTMDIETLVPEDLLDEILLHLPLNSLVQCKILSRGWNNRSCRLIRTYFERYTKPISTLFLLSRGPVLMILPRNNGDISSICHTVTRYVQYDCTNVLTKSRVVGTHHGLICFSDLKAGNARVWNPVMKKLRKFDFKHQGYDPFNTLFGFGFDAIKDDYKVVRISSNARLEANCVTIEICELRNTETRVMPTVQVQFMLINATPITVNGSSHWIAFHPKNKILEIVRFDMDHEKFVEIPFSDDMPNIYYDVNIRRIEGLNLGGLALQGDDIEGYDMEGYAMDGKLFRLGVLKGFLCLFISDSLKVEIWLMNRNDGRVVWTRMFEIPKRGKIENVVGFTADEELVLRYKDNTYFAYDPWRKGILYAFQRSGVIHQAVTYIESRVNVVPQ